MATTQPGPVVGDRSDVRWQVAEVRSPTLDRPTTVIAAKGVPYASDANRFQNLNLYLPHTPETAGVIGTAASRLPGIDTAAGRPHHHVHIHGGAWRDPFLGAASIEPMVAHAFADGAARSRRSPRSTTR